MAIDKNSNQTQGFITAKSENDARTLLAGMKINFSDLKEAEVGRDNPFTPYYQPVVPVVSAIKTTNKTTITKPVTKP